MGILDAVDGGDVTIGAPTPDHMLTPADLDIIPELTVPTVVIAQCTTEGCRAHGVPIELLVEAPVGAVWTGTACGGCNKDSAHRPALP